MHLLKDGMTCVPCEKWLHPQLLRHLAGLESLAGRLKECGMDWKALEVDGLTEAESSAADYIDMMRYTGSSVVYGLPFLSEEYCDKLVIEANEMHRVFGYEVNPDEDMPYQIPELVVAQHCSQLYTSLKALFDRVFSAYCTVIYGYQPKVLRTVQFAKYQPENTAKGNWHTDLDSDITAVVSLQPETYVGGGTEIRQGMNYTKKIPKLPKGYALLFPGKCYQHRGLPVESGTRDLLVFWSEVKINGLND